MSTVQVSVPVLGIVHFFGGIGTGIGKNWYRKKVSLQVSFKILGTVILWANTQSEITLVTAFHRLLDGNFWKSR